MPVRRHPLFFQWIHREHTLWKLKIKSNSQTYHKTKHISVSGMQTLLNIVAYVAEITIQNLNVTVYNFQSNQFVIVLVNACYKEQTCISSRPSKNLVFGPLFSFPRYRPSIDDLFVWKQNVSRSESVIVIWSVGNSDLCTLKSCTSWPAEPGRAAWHLWRFSPFLSEE